jgi:hypothetical protein
VYDLFVSANISLCLATQDNFLYLPLLQIGLAGVHRLPKVFGFSGHSGALHVSFILHVIDDAPYPFYF